MNETKSESFLEIRAIFDRLVYSKKGINYAVFHAYATSSPFWVKLQFIDEDIADSLSAGDVVSVRIGCIPYSGSAFLTYRVLGIVSKGVPYEGS